VPFKGVPKGKEDPRTMYQEEQIEAIVRCKGTPSEETWPLLREHPYYERAKKFFYPPEHPEGVPADESSPMRSDPELAAVFYELCAYDPERRPTAFEALTAMDYFAKTEPEPTRNIFDYELAAGEHRIVYPHRKITHEGDKPPDDEAKPARHDAKRAKRQ